MFLFESKNKYDIIIIGGGISGLFLSYKLSKTNFKILLIESDKAFGGRVHTVEKNKIKYECAAARFNDNHTKLKTLINELNLEDKMITLPKEIKYVLRGYKKNYQYRTENKLDLNELLQNSIKERKNFNDFTLQNITFFQYLVDIYDNETACFIKDAFGYDSEFLFLNALAAIDMFNEDLFSDKDYYILGGGLSQIIENLLKNIKKHKNVTMILGEKVNQIYSEYIETNKTKYYYENLICTIPKHNLKEFTLLKNIPEIDSVDGHPLLRIYAKYPVKDLWFKNLKRTTTDNLIRQIIPIDYSNGLIMISYTDGEYAKMLNKAYFNGEDYLIRIIHQEIKDLLKLNPPEPEFLAVHYWDVGLHLWKPGYNMELNSKKIIKPFPEKNIFICGETYSKKQGWMEGSLDTCYDVLNILPLLKDNFEITTDNNVINLEDITKKITDEKKIFTIEEIIKENNLVIMDINNEKRVYDISSWAPIHPGGSMIIKAVDANKYYLNKKGKSPKKLWLEYHSEELFKKFFIEQNEYIQQVGILK